MPTVYRLTVNNKEGIVVVVGEKKEKKRKECMRARTYTLRVALCTRAQGTAAMVEDMTPSLRVVLCVRADGQ